MQQEADYFWRRYKEDPNVPLPHTYNLVGYMSVRSDVIPEYLRKLDSGIHHIGDNGVDNVIHVSRSGDNTLYLVFNRTQVNKLIALYGLVPLACVLVLLYLTLWIAYRISLRALSPVTWLARKVNRLDPGRPDVSEFSPEKLPADSDYEIRTLTRAIQSFAQRLNDFVERESNFTRDASHELRTPLTVINVAADVLMMEKNLSQQSLDSLKRIKRACGNMEEVTTAFLMLAREAEIGGKQELSVNRIVNEEVDQALFLVDDKELDIKVIEHVQLNIHASGKIVSVLLGNLIRNAVSYTAKGHVKVYIENGYVVIEDTGPGMSEQEVERLFQPYVRGRANSSNGYGVGLTIVKRISRQFEWPLEVSSRVGAGTKVTVHFNKA